VRVMASVEEVNRAFGRGDLANRQNLIVHAFFQASNAKGRIGSITIPGNVQLSTLLELVSHECTHAAISVQRFRGESWEQPVQVCDDVEESIATLTGELTCKVMKELLKGAACQR
jgi:hypothetical protein